MKTKLLWVMLFIGKLSIAQWVDLNLNQSANSVIEVNNTIYAGTANGVFYKNLNSVQWNQSNDITTEGISFLEDDSDLYVTSYGKVYKSSDHGLTWFTLYDNPILYQNINNIFKSDEHIVLGSNGNGIFFSPDEGANWYRSGSSWQSKNTALVEMDSKLYSSSTSNGNMQVSSNLTGQNWASIGGNGLKFPYSASYPDIKSLNVLDGKTIIAGVNDKDNSGSQSGVFFSDDEGMNWEKRNSGLTNTYVNSVVNAEGIVFTGTDNGIFYSIDEGNSWSDCNENLRNRVIKKVYIKSPNIYAVTSTGVYKADICTLINKTSKITLIDDTQINSIEHLRLEANTDGILYKWFKDDIRIPDSNSNTYFPIETGTYKVQVYYSKNCFSFSNAMEITIEAEPPQEIIEPEKIRYYPNPVADFLNIGNVELNGKKFEIFNAFGMSVKKGVVEENKIDVRNCAKGLYIVVVNGVHVLKVLK